MTKAKKEKGFFNFRVDRRTRETLDELSRRMGKTRSETIRSLVYLAASAFGKSEVFK